jgi:hypothetical protein
MENCEIHKETEYIREYLKQNVRADIILGKKLVAQFFWEYVIRRTSIPSQK